MKKFKDFVTATGILVVGKLSPLNPKTDGVTKTVCAPVVAFKKLTEVVVQAVTV